MCDCGNNCNIPVGPIGPQGIQGDQGVQGIQGVPGTPASDIPLVWINIPLTNNWVAGTITPQYRISGGYLYFRGIVQRSTPTVAAFTFQDFGFTKVVQTIVGDDRSPTIKGDFTLEKLIFRVADGGVEPFFNEVHTLLLDSMPPLNIQ